MTRLNLILVIAVIFSAMFLVHSHYQARRSFMALEAASKEATRLELEHERLQVERRAQALGHTRHHPICEAACRFAKTGRG